MPVGVFLDYVVVMVVAVALVSVVVYLVIVAVVVVAAVVFSLAVGVVVSAGIFFIVTRSRSMSQPL